LAEDFTLNRSSRQLSSWQRTSPLTGHPDSLVLGRWLHH
jgi:hypothetical protein